MIHQVMGWGKELFTRQRQRIVAAGLVAGVLAFLTWSIVKEWDTVVAYPWRLSVGYLLLALVFHSLALGFTFVVWHLMIRRLGHYGDLGANAHIYYLSTLAKRIPSAIWYVGGRLMMYQERGVVRSAVLNATALETVLVGSAGVVVYLVLQPFYTYAAIEGSWIMAGLGGFAALLFLVRPRFSLDVTNAVLRRLKRTPIEAELSRRDLALWGAIYLVPWPLTGVSLFFMIRAVTTGVTADLVSIIGVSTLSMLVALLSLILPAGLGLKELTAAALLTTWMPLSAGLVIAIAYRILLTFDDLFWAAVAWRLGRRRPPALSRDD